MKNLSLTAVVKLIKHLSFEDLLSLGQWLSEEIDRVKRQRTARSLLEDARRSDRAIALEVGVSAPFVAKVRRDLIESGELKVESYRIDRRGRKHGEKEN